MIVWSYLMVPAYVLDDEPQREHLERDLHAYLDQRAAEAGLPPVDHDLVDISAQRETDAGFGARQADYDARAADEGWEPHTLTRLGWLRAEVPVSGPSNASPATPAG